MSNETTGNQNPEPISIRQLLDDPQGMVRVELQHRKTVDGSIEIYTGRVSGVIIPAAPVTAVSDRWPWPLLTEPPFFALNVFVDIEKDRWLVQCSTEYNEQGDLLDNPDRKIGSLVGGDPKGYGPDFMSALMNALVASKFILESQVPAQG